MCSRAGLRTAFSEGEFNLASYQHSDSDQEEGLSCSVVSSPSKGTESSSGRRQHTSTSTEDLPHDSTQTPGPWLGKTKAQEAPSDTPLFSASGTPLFLERWSGTRGRSLRPRAQCPFASPTAFVS